MRILDIEIWNEGNFHARIHIWIGIYRLCNRIDELDDALGHEVTGRRFASKNEGARWYCQRRVLLEPAIHGNNVQNVQMLALVFMNALHLNVKQPAGIDLDPGLRLDVRCEALLVAEFYGAPVALKGVVAGVNIELAQQDRFRQPLLAERTIE